MKERFIDQLKPGERIQEVFVLSEKNMGTTKDGRVYMSGKAADKTGTVNVVMFDGAAAAAEIPEGSHVLIQGDVGEYKGAVQIKIGAMALQQEEAIDPADFMPSTSRNVDAMFERLKKIMFNTDSPHYKALFESFLNDAPFEKKYKTAPAGKFMHHAYIGGLLEHTLSMAVLAEKVAAHYSGVNKNLLMAGVLFHDIGKTKELSCDNRIDYTDEGRLIGHITLGCQMVADHIRALENFPEKDAMLIQHMIVSHHGEQAFGSPEPPKTVEAVLLHYLDEMDSKITAVRSFMDKHDKNDSWTGYHRILARHIYLGGPDEPSGETD